MIDNITDINRKKIVIVFISTFFFGMLAHSFAYLNIFLNHDSLWINHNNHFAFLEAHGRFFVRIWAYIQGGLTTPFLNGIFSLFFTSLGSLFLIKTLEIRNNFPIMVLSAIFATAPILAFSNASYVFFSDIYMFSFFLSMAAIYIFKKYKYGFIWAIPLIICSLGLYQSYLQVATAVIVIYLIKNILFDSTSAKNIVIKGSKGIILLTASALWYFIIIKYLNPQELSTYKNYSSIGNYQNVNILKLLLDVYLYPIQYIFINPTVYTSVITEKWNIVAGANSTLLIISIYSIFILIRKKISNQNIIILISLILLLPLAMNFLSFVAKQKTGTLTLHSTYIFLIFSVILLDNHSELKISFFTACTEKSKSVLIFIIYLCFTINIHSNILFANQLYTYKDIHFKGTLSLATRIIERIENLDGFNPMVNNFIFIGDTMRNPLYNYRILKKTYDPRNQFFIDGTITYAINTYINSLLGLNYMPLSGNKVNEILTSKIVKNMPMFPHKNSVQLINGIAVVKISEN